jgi:shikimate dehydrogenase
MNISGSTRVFLILGDPVEQVRAPEVFNHLFAKHGVDAVLVPAKVSEENLASFANASLLAENIEGLWLTIPHKAAMVPLLDHCDAAGRVAGAVNAVRRRADGSLEGALFDGIGFAKALVHFGIAAAGAKVLIVGAGGAGVAIAGALAARGARRIALHDSTPGRAAKAVAQLAGEFGAGIVGATGGEPAGYGVVINATPLGLEPHDPLPFDVARLDAGAKVIDILMKNQPTRLLRACHARGITAHPGFEMMVQQVPEYLSFFGFERIARSVRGDASDVRALLAAA